MNQDISLNIMRGLCLVSTLFISVSAFSSCPKNVSHYGCNQYTNEEQCKTSYGIFDSKPEGDTYILCDWNKTDKECFDKGPTTFCEDGTGAGDSMNAVKNDKKPNNKMKLKKAMSNKQNTPLLDKKNQPRP